MMLNLENESSLLQTSQSVKNNILAGLSYFLNQLSFANQTEFWKLVQIVLYMLITCKKIIKNRTWYYFVLMGGYKKNTKPYKMIDIEIRMRKERRFITRYRRFITRYRRFFSRFSYEICLYSLLTSFRCSNKKNCHYSNSSRQNSVSKASLKNNY